MVLTMIKHHCFIEAIQAEFRGIVGCAAGERVFARQAADVDDGPAATLAQPRMASLQQ